MRFTITVQPAYSAGSPTVIQGAQSWTLADGALAITTARGGILLYPIAALTYAEIREEA